MEQLSALLPQKGLIYTNVADTIGTYIKSHALRAGDKLPSERKLSEELGISRNSVREGLRVLENSGIISVRSGIGAFVERENPSDSVRLQFIRVNFIELLEIKCMLEMGVIEKLTRSDTDLTALDEPVAVMMEKWRNGVYDGRTDRKFHMMLVEKAENHALYTMFEEIINILDGYWAQIEMETNKLQQTIPYHQQLLESIRKHDLTGANAAYMKIRDIDVALMTEQSEGD